jgi:transcriptional regulator with XRE-family HTH domain
LHGLDTESADSVDSVPMRYAYGKELRRLREEAGLLLKDAAAAVHPAIARGYLSQIELGQKTPFDIERTRQIEKFLLSKLARMGKKEHSKLVLYEVCYRLSYEFEGLSDACILKVGKEIAKELYDYG